MLIRVPTYKKARAAVAVMLCLCLAFASLLNVKPAAAMVYMSIDTKPGRISNSATATFTFSGYDSDVDDYYAGGTECQVDANAFASCTSPFVTPSLSAGDHSFTVHAVGQSSSNATVSYSWNINQKPVFAGGSSVTGVAGSQVAVSDLSIVDADNDILGVKLAVPSGVLALASTTGITFSGSPTGSTITFHGTRTDINSALASLTYTPSTTGTIDITATLTGAAGGARDTFNGHVYSVVPTTATWVAAKATAEASTYGGVSGYLATVTSSEEKDYLQARMNDGVWIGSSDSGNESVWSWRGGPENGTVFSNGSTAVSGQYTNWQASQPDNYGGENCGEMRTSSGESWNDSDCSTSKPYIIEYGTDGALPILDTALVSATSVDAAGDTDGDGTVNSIEAAAPNNGDANNDATADYSQANVSSVYNSQSSDYTVVQTSCAANQQVVVSPESVSQKDPAYNYPYGLASFTATTCGSPGTTVSVTQYFYGVTDPSTLTLRKWNSSTGLYSTIDGAVISSVTIGGKQAIKVVYQIIDGGILDQDGVANGSITDPAGLAVVVVEVPNTGLKHETILLPLAYSLLGLMLLIADSVYVLRRRSKVVD